MLTQQGRHTCSCSMRRETTKGGDRNTEPGMYTSPERHRLRSADECGVCVCVCVCEEKTPISSIMLKCDEATSM